MTSSAASGNDCLLITSAYPTVPWNQTDCCSTKKSDKINIICSPDGRRGITVLNIKVPVNGPIPDQISQLQDLTYLDLSGCGHAGPIPDSLSNLSQLSELALFSNRLNGTIPESLGKLTQLRRIALSNNFLEGPIPESFRQLQNLGRLFLRGNSLSGKIPQSLANLPNLSELYISKNLLSGVVPTFKAPLNTLAIHDNYFSGPIPSDIYKVFANVNSSLSTNCFKPDYILPIKKDYQSLNITQRAVAECEAVIGKQTTADPTSGGSGSGSSSNSSSDSSSGPNIILIAAPSAAAVLIIIIVAAVLLVRRNRRNVRADLKASNADGREAPAALAPSQDAPSAALNVHAFDQRGAGDFKTYQQQPVGVVHGDLFHQQASKPLYHSMNNGPGRNETVTVPFTKAEMSYDGQYSQDIKAPPRQNLPAVYGIESKSEYVPMVTLPSPGSGSGGPSAPMRTFSKEQSGISGWDPAKVSVALSAAGVNPYFVKRLEDYRVDGRQLVGMDHDRLEQMGIEPFDARVTLLVVIGMLRERNDADGLPQYS
ncbi:hypothetical protein HDU97_004415 [Phlyctochytrium planicorne]|nr:hypothetical protein HDU97_004415 [Phlyctochytrium planicorne]